MNLRRISFFGLAFVLLTACGQEPETILLERSLLSEEEFAEKLAGIRRSVGGEVLGDLQWRAGDEQVYTMLSSELDAEGYRGIFLRHYRVGDPGVELRWTYQDTIKCAGADAGATLVRNASPALRPEGITSRKADEFILRYTLGCPGASTEILTVVDAASGTPNLRLEGNDQKVFGAKALLDLPEDTLAQLLAYWE